MAFKTKIVPGASENKIHGTEPVVCMFDLAPSDHTHTSFYIYLCEDFPQA